MRRVLVIAVGLLVAGAVIVVVGLRASDQPATLGPVRAGPGGLIPFSDGIGPAVHAAKVAAIPPTLAARPVTMNVQGFGAWSLLDRRTGKVSGSQNMNEPNTSESMIKAWIVADFLRRTSAGNKKPPQAQLQQASSAIRHSDDHAAQALYQAGGGDAVVKRMISTCGLRRTTLVHGRWADTKIPSSDAVQMGLCVADGRAAGPNWTDWLLSEMRQVSGGVTDQPPNFCCTGGGRWGIIDGLPPELASEVSIKNGWTPIWADGLWHVNCLAIHPDWVLCVQARYPYSLGLQYGADACRSVTEQLLTKH